MRHLGLGVGVFGKRCRRHEAAELLRTEGNDVIDHVDAHAVGADVGAWMLGGEGCTGVPIACGASVGEMAGQCDGYGDSQGFCSWLGFVLSAPGGIDAYQAIRQTLRGQSILKPG